MLGSRRILLPCRIKWKRKLCLFCVSIPFVVGLGLLIYLNHLKCSYFNGEEYIATTCKLYHGNYITGNMCSKLCDENAIRYRYCGGEMVNKMALILECDGCAGAGVTSKVVLKSRGIHSLTSKVVAPIVDNQTFKVKVKKMHGEIVKRLYERYQMDFSEDSKFLEFILGDSFVSLMNTVDNTKAGDIILIVIQSLVVQDEFLAMTVLGNTSIMPDIYGTCGPAYLVEYIPPFAFSNHVLLSGRVTDFLKLSQRFPTWKERARLGLRVLEFVRKADSAFDRPLHVCDGVPANIGVNGKGNVILLDSDRTIFENVYGHGQPCKTDDDCVVETMCRAVCDKTNRTCTKEVKGNNLQRMCQKIFLSKVERFGLLRSPPASIAVELDRLLRQCASDDTPDLQRENNGRSDNSELEEFERLLKLSLLS